jgi:hypothetical protein
LSPVIVCVGHLISHTPQPMHVSVMKWGIPSAPAQRAGPFLSARTEKKYHMLAGEPELSGSPCVGR